MTGMAWIRFGTPVICSRLQSIVLATVLVYVFVLLLFDSFTLHHFITISNASNTSNTQQWTDR